jgi:hypothetical protein
MVLIVQNNTLFTKKKKKTKEKEKEKNQFEVQNKASYLPKRLTIPSFTA